ncbi:hypothetical protein [Sphingobacterium lactis]|uniref:Uncharacterized protein n=1 Tax=Sphingobacterium lactis TaxID=797291 RepID=A0A1H6CG25_9SPHI|nr:hypothetical protein [Sphingobacterium lactis]SEG71934.1 hypothetical protein SAMN05421877_11560 [Sphingobacterium lactis]
MRKVCCIFLMLLSLLMGFQQAIVIVHFKLNQQTLEEQFCINKNRPEMNCHALCFLKKKLRNQGDATSNSLSNYKKIDLMHTELFGLKSEVFGTQMNQIHIPYGVPVYTGPVPEVRIPPPISRST